MRVRQRDARREGRRNRLATLRAQLQTVAAQQREADRVFWRETTAYLTNAIGPDLVSGFDYRPLLRDAAEVGYWQGRDGKPFDPDAALAEALKAVR